MRTLIIFATATALFATPALAQNAVEPANTTTTTTTVTTDNMVVTDNGMTMDPTMNAALPPADIDPMAPAPGDEPAAPVERKSGFPWGLLGLIGLIGLIGRRS